MGITIPLTHPYVGDAEIAAVVRVMRSGHLVQGAQVAAFEDEFTAVVGKRTCVAVSSGTSALHLALLACGIGPGDEVIVPSFTFGATAHAVVHAGATPVFADIAPETLTLDPDAVSAAITTRTAAIVPVHLFGHPAAMDRLVALAARHHLALVEDAAQAAGAALDGTPIGSFGHAAAFSFYPTKNMHSIEGGMVATSDIQTAQRLRLLRNQGLSGRYEYEVVGYNARMTDVAAAVGRTQLASLAWWTARRRANAAYLDDHLQGVATPTVAPGADPVYHQYVVRADNRDLLRERLASVGIQTGVHYPLPVHRSHAYARPYELPHTERAATEVLSLPVHPHLTTTELAYLAEQVNT
ncbi:DegT/DnrJ/EryC1/StrS aminotransferase family protein [Micromonospora sp. 4G55]|uniref:DegT/DnrJ/EryC1/StrS family aminotransferase n=1 Tax=Micromonospora sp. 4G55 TaxID=2806102 RepID=UPI001A52B2CA|nr:DegT/DnrJ/EryC1/StrS family aminotransferase [Micromonospora sp. 4G55]MBM0256505.1 DegT/DnrJ/EryC1/StrS family aminotransferase [Micromonospora sp. 4G55]